MASMNKPITDFPKEKNSQMQARGKRAIKSYTRRGSSTSKPFSKVKGGK